MRPYFSHEEVELAEKLKMPKAREDYEKLYLGMEIKKLRRKAGMTQRDLAKKLQTSQSVVARMETGKQNFTIQTLLKIAGIFGKRIFLKFDK